MSAHEYEVRAAWRRCAGDAHAAGQTLDALLERHREPHRHYHTIAHVAWVIRHVAVLAADEHPDDPCAIVAAACFHDAVYDPRAHDNEAASARLAAAALVELGWTAERIGHVISMIEATAGHRVDAAADPDAAILVDADLAVLGSDPAAYATYANGVRTEYAHLDDHAWRTGRAVVLEAFLERPQIFATESGRHLFEATARANVTAELASLR